MGVQHKEDSIATLRQQEQAAASKDAKIAEQAEEIELLKGCIMELAAVVYGEEVPKA